MKNTLDNKQDQGVKELLDIFFDRAIIALSYSAANKITLLISNTNSNFVVNNNNNNSLIKPAFVMFILSLSVALIILANKHLNTNYYSGIQTTLSILISKIFTSLFPLPEEQKGSYCILPSLLFHLIMCSSICSFLRFAFEKNKIITALCDRIIPFIILFSSSMVFQQLTDNRQMHLLYLFALCYLVFIQIPSPPQNRYKDHIFSSTLDFFLLFVDSIMCRALVLGIQDYVKAMVDNMDIALAVFNIGILVVLNYFLVMVGNYGPSQIQYCTGVMIFTISQQLFVIVQKYCGNEPVHSFIISLTVFTSLLYNKICRQIGKSIFVICINCLSLAWSLLIENWLSSFYGGYEPFLVFLVVFLAIQNLQEATYLIVDFTQDCYASHRIANVIAYGYEMMSVIAHSDSSSIGLPPPSSSSP